MKRDKKSLNHIFSSASGKETEATGTGVTQRTRCWHLPEKTAGQLANRAIDCFFEYFREIDPKSSGQRERACVTRFLQRGIASAYPPSKLVG